MMIANGKYLYTQALLFSIRILGLPSVKTGRLLVLFECNYHFLFFLLETLLRACIGRFHARHPDLLSGAACRTVGRLFYPLCLSVPMASDPVADEALQAAIRLTTLYGQPKPTAGPSSHLVIKPLNMDCSMSDISMPGR